MRANRLLLGLALLGAACDRGGPLPPDPGGEAGGTATLVNFDAAGRPLVRFDTRGNQVDAHGGEMRWFEGRYYLYAETYGCGFEWRKLSPSPFCGFRVYSSPNLVEWTDHGLLFDVSRWEPWQGRCHWFTNGCFRPHVVYNRATRKYVLWVNVYDRPVSYYVLESDSPTGPFVERGVPRLAFNTDAAPGLINNGDQNLFVDRDGTGYLVYTEWAKGQGNVIVEQLTPDYLNGTGRHVSLGVSRTEAPTLFERDGRYYLTVGAPNCGYCAAGTVYRTAPSPLGPWSAPRQISGNSCGGQPAHVAQLPAADGGSWYLYMSDLWLDSDPRDGGDLNQGPAPQFWALLRFDEAGEIRPITCERSYRVPALISAPPAREPDSRRLQCDVAHPAGGRRVMREFRFTAERTGRARSVAVNAYQRGEPTAPLVVDLRAVGADTGAMLHRSSYQPKGATWDAPLDVAWAARRLELPLDVPVEAGRRYAVRVQSATPRGCYGFAYFEGSRAGAAASWVSPDGGAGWTAEAGEGVQVELVIDGG
ncbi:MAG TPA: family 43 glycosylhydrolase [Longimicrobiaceae bacterium]|nr:family 43 glycosylhydrolase [Longimicrobiaceae bacterium]